MIYVLVQFSDLLLQLLGDPRYTNPCHGFSSVCTHPCGETCTLRQAAPMMLRKNTPKVYMRP